MTVISFPTQISRKSLQGRWRSPTTLHSTWWYSAQSNRSAAWSAVTRSRSSTKRRAEKTGTRARPSERLKRQTSDAVSASENSRPSRSVAPDALTTKQPRSGGSVDARTRIHRMFVDAAGTSCSQRRYFWYLQPGDGAARSAAAWRASAAATRSRSPAASPSASRSAPRRKASVLAPSRDDHFRPRDGGSAAATMQRAQTSRGTLESRRRVRTAAMAESPSQAYSMMSWTSSSGSGSAGSSAARDAPSAAAPTPMSRNAAQ